MKQLEHTTKLQQKASNPQYSVFVCASAGSGKTKILTDRVLRLLLSGVHPSKILCLTFTKVAALEMQNRIYKKLSDWTYLKENQLEEELFKLSGSKPSNQQLQDARILFAKTLDSNPDLKISTIHSFCESLIRKFPVEIKINPNFQIVDSKSEFELLGKARKELLKNALQDPILKEKISNISSLLNENSFSEIILELINKRDQLLYLKEKYFDISGVIEQIYKLLSCKIGDNQTAIDQLMIEESFDKAALTKLCEYMQSSKSKTDQKNHLIISHYINAPSKEAFAEYKSVFLKRDKDEGAKALTSVATKKSVLEVFADAEAIIEQEQQRILKINDRVNSIAIANATADLLFIADKMLEIYISHKSKNGLLDYNDLISKGSHLLCDSDNADWIKYKLDGNLEHILVDESQDTNGYQWSIINALADEFFSGEAAIEKKRTIFIVGDEKQSIYSFQGADPEIFGNIYHYYKDKSAELENQIQDIELHNSFRSSAAVLKAVDLVFAKTEHKKAISKLKAVKHNAIRDEYFGKVELLPIINSAASDDDAVGAKKKDDLTWLIDFNQEKEYHCKELLAQRIVGTIKKWFSEKRLLKSKNRPIEYGDIMILLKNRTNGLGDLLIKHFQEEQIPVNGKDKIELTQHIITQDLLAAAKFILFEKDDLNLACLLKSPLIAMDEEVLLQLCLDKNQQNISLFSSLEHSKNAVWSTYNYLVDIKNFALTNSDKIYELFFYILEIKGGRKAIINRFGKEAEEII
ncbi:MAG: UvrD-helicase domain-containing protein, partial [Proteobacteria bacterium]|nr:UvrD-helicase domain-containing protein [Pseudomonadota bacterium]